MYKINDTTGISIEQFAAYLDGNLPDAAMREMTDVIDSNEEYSHIIADVIQVDDTVAMYESQSDVLLTDIPDTDFDLPVIPVVAETVETAELHVAAETDVTASEEEDIRLVMAPEISDATDDPSSSQPSEPPVMVSDDDYGTEQEAVEFMDFDDFT